VELWGSPRTGENGIRRNRHNPTILPIFSTAELLRAGCQLPPSLDEKLSFRSLLPTTARVAEGWNNPLALVSPMVSKLVWRGRVHSFWEVA
jgi:hypothetical protein